MCTSIHIFVIIRTESKIMKSELLNLGKDLKTKRLEAGISQGQLSILSGFERSQLSKIEKGTVKGVTYVSILKLYKTLGFDISFVKDKNLKYEIHPFVKWAGGKTQLLSKLEDHLPKSFNKYYEPFIGGGALLFKLQPKEFYINDMNTDLTSAYKCFTTEEDFRLLKKELLKHEKKHSEDYYYKIREMDREDDYNKLPKYIRVARLIYLNKACFNGLYRVNSKGYFNVPSGKYEKVNCFDRDNFENLYMYFNATKSKITNVDFEDAVKSAEEGDFVYFDPPYDTLDDKDSFTSYDKSVFGKREQARLSNVFKALDKKGVKLMLSNHNTKYINELYSGYKIDVIEAKRMINSNANGRGKVEEVIITNYE